MCVLWVIPALSGLFLMRYLHQQGYTWATLEVAAAVIRKVGRKAYAIPPADEVETLPGFKRNAECLIAIAKLVDKYKDKLTKSTR